MKIKQHLVKMFPLIGIWETCLLNECSSVSWCNDNNHIKMSNSICEALTSQHLKRCQQQEKTYWHMVDGWKPRVNLEVSWGFSFPQNISNDTSVKTLVERVNPLYAVRVGVSPGSGVLNLFAPPLSIDPLVIPVNISHHALRHVNLAFKVGVLSRDNSLVHHCVLDLGRAASVNFPYLFYQGLGSREQE